MRHPLLVTAIAIATAEDRALPHVHRGYYDTRWEAVDARSLGDLRALAPADGHAAVLVALIDDLAPGDDFCSDLHESCGHWAGLGECENNPNYMRRDCAKPRAAW